MKEGELRLGSTSKTQLDGGLCLYEESSIGLNQSPYGGLLNMCLDDGGMPIKRPGQRYIFQKSLGDGGINALYPDYKGYTIIAHGTKLYKQRGAEQPTEIYNELSNSKAFMFVFNGILYLLNGSQYIQYDGISSKVVEPYKPRVSMNRKPDGSSSEIDESWNMLGRGFKNTFNGDGTSKSYKLSLDGLDSDIVTCNVGGKEGSGFTVDRVKGIVTFDTAPDQGTNNIEIIAFKTFSGLRENILKCKFGVEFSNRMFLSGNENIPNYYFASGVTDQVDASYFPEKYKYAIRGIDKAVTGFKVHYNKLIVFKEDLTCTVEAATGLDNTASFPIQYLNTDIGCDIPNSIQLVNNNIVFANTYGGVYIIVSTIVPGEKSITPVSLNINGSFGRPGLMDEDINNLKKATSIDYGYKYYLCVGEKCYVWDYKDNFSINTPRNLKWFLYDNIHANCFGVRNNELIYGHSSIGMLCAFTNTLNDFGEPIKGVWKSKLIDFGYPDWLKTINYIWYTCKANSSSEISVNYYNDNGELLASIVVPGNKIKSFSWSNFSWDSLTWKVQIFAPTIRLKPRVKRIKYFQIELENNKFNENLSIISLIIKYTTTKKVR